MIPVVTPEQMQMIEKNAYQQGYREEVFMENAGKGIADNLSVSPTQRCRPKPTTAWSSMSHWTLKDQNAKK